MKPIVSKRHWLRLNLRSGFVLMTLVGCLFAWIAKERRQSTYERSITQKYDTHWSFWPHQSTDENQANLADGSWARWWGLLLGERVYSLRVHDEIDLTRIAKLRSIRQLKIHGVPAISLKGIENLRTLEVLEVSAESISDMRQLASLTNLKTLLISGRTLDDVTSLSHLRNLQTLVLSGCSTNDLSLLASLDQLEELRLRPIDGDLTEPQVQYLQEMLPGCRVMPSPRVLEE